MIDTPLRSTTFERSGNECSQPPFLVTKFRSPVQIHMMQTRTRLLTLLRRGLFYPLLLVSAPPGFGKTTLLSQWVQSLEEEHVTTVWISLDASDNEPEHFWHVLLAALTQKLPVFGTLEGKREVGIVSSLLTLLINTCATQQEPIVLVLDDYHTITDGAIQEQMAYCIEHLPPHIHIVLSTRVEPYLPLARLRVRQQMLEVRTNALRFTYEEATLFFNEVMHLPLTATETRYIVDHVDGWIAGLRLAGYALYESYTGERVSVASRGSQRFILDYILEEVFFLQEEHLQTFLLRTSLLSHFSASLCDAVLGRQDSWQLLRQIERANLFLVAEDDEHGWYHYQAVFAEALHSRLERTESEMVPVLHRRASHWYEQHGFFFEAIEHLCQAQEWEHALNLIEHIIHDQSVANVENPSLPVLRNLLVRLPKDLVQMRPQLHFLLAISEPEERNILALFAPQQNEICEEPQVQELLLSQQLLDPLSTRELEVLQLMAQGATNDDIANQLIIALGTVKRHVSNILSKLQASNRTQAVAYARRLGLLS